MKGIFDEKFRCLYYQFAWLQYQLLHQVEFVRPAAHYWHLSHKQQTQKVSYSFLSRIQAKWANQIQKIYIQVLWRLVILFKYKHDICQTNDRRLYPEGTSSRIKLIFSFRRNLFMSLIQLHGAFIGWFHICCIAKTSFLKHYLHNISKKEEPTNFHSKVKSATRQRRYANYLCLSFGRKFPFGWIKSILN